MFRILCQLFYIIQSTLWIRVKVAQIPVPWQFWLAPDDGTIRDVIQLSDTYPFPVTLRRQFTTSPTVIPLDNLNWGVGTGWQPNPAETIVLAPGFQTDISIPVDHANDAAVLVRYEVDSPSLPGSIVTRFVNEAILGPAVMSRLLFNNQWEMEWRRPLTTGTVFDIVRGDLATMRANEDCSDASCLANNWPTHTYLTGAPPLAGQCYYYLVRSETASGLKGTYDTDWTHPESRDLEVGSPDCP